MFSYTKKQKGVMHREDRQFELAEAELTGALDFSGSRTTPCTKAYGDFYTRLAEQCPDLTRTEMQPAAMLRLNLTSKEIAHILNQSIVSIDKTRHQLR